MYRKLEMHSDKNIFVIQNPEENFCRVWSYFVSHSRLLLRVYRGKIGEEEFYLNFEMVQYFEGSLGWKGATFYIGSSEECVKLLQQQGFEGLPDEDILEHFRLYVVDLPNSRCLKILAGKNASKTISIPPDFSWLITCDDVS
jgi:hypothetical protein